MARRQFAAVGVTPTMARERIARGQLTRLHRGVYAVGHRRLLPTGRAMAAVLAVGPGAVLSHRSAAARHGIASPRGGAVDVTTTRRSAAVHPGIRVHRAPALSAEDVTTIDAVPVTTAARTLVDLADVLRPDALAKAIGEAERLRLLDMGALEAAIARARTRNGPGHAALRAALREHVARGVELDRSELERRFAALVAQVGCSRPRFNHWIEGVEVDAVWPRERIAVELDGWEFHRHRRAFQRDRDKANALAEAGWTVLRFTHHDVVRRPARVAAQLERVLRAPRR